MIHKISITIALFFVSIMAFADGIPVETAQKIAKNFYFEKTGIEQTKSSFSEELLVTEQDKTIFYAFNFAEGGFVLVSAEDVLNPIIGYSLSNTYSVSDQTPNVKFWNNQYAEKINYINSNNIQVSEKVEKNWQKYNVDFNEFQAETTTEKGVNPLVNHIEWNQQDGWNDYCPNGALTGCVATGMGIIMKYWEYPASGNASYEYTPAGYSPQSVNYENASYNWSAMSNDSPNSASAELIYHAGVSVEMQYGADGSAAYTRDVQNAIWFYFLYQYPSYSKREGMSDTEWKDLLKSDLDQARPIFYAGQSNDGGHAFLCDGYDNSDYFHYNFGWGGYNNGFYDIDDPQGYSSGQEALTGIEPDHSFNAKEIRNKSSENQLVDFSVYPNPASESFKIGVHAEVLSVEIFNIMGAKVLSVEGKREINVSELQSGIYFLKIETDKGILNQKLIVR